MDSSAHQHYDPQEPQSQQPSSGLLRFRSAPSSLFGNFMDSRSDKARFESERLVSRFLKTGGDKSLPAASPTFAGSQQGYSGLPPHYPRQSAAASSSAMDSNSSSYEFLPIDHQGHGKSVGSNLSRQNSSPPGLLASLSVQNGYSNMKVVGDYGGVNGSNGDVSPLSNRMKNPIAFSSRLPSSLGMLSQIPETEAEAIAEPDGKLKSGNLDPQFYNSSFPYYGSSSLMENFSGMKRERDGDHNGGMGDRVPRLSHHFSLPKTSSEMAAVEKFLQFQDSVPCKIRAKRGCATHPRSIAERVRRTRISERMRKLQELVPNMDKQTNTADMLDLAVDYIKDLQGQFKALSDRRAKCRCPNIQKVANSQFV